jgi:Flp pilus assembly protein TadD
VAEARLLFERGHLEQAERILRDYLRARENSADAHYLLGYIYFQQIHQQLQPPSTPPSDRPGAQTVDPHFLETRAKESLAELRQAAKYRDPSPFDMKVAALDYILLKDYPNADKWLTHSLESNPDDNEGWYYLGRTKYKENRFAEAVETFQRFLKLVPGSVKGEDNLGLAYQGLGRTDDAIGAYRTAIGEQKDSLIQDAGPLLDLGTLLLDQNRTEQSVSYLQQAVAVAPEDARGHEQLGKAYDRLGQLTRAQSELEKASELSPQNPRLHYLLGRVYQREGFEDKAKNEFDRSQALGRTPPSEGNEE